MNNHERKVARELSKALEAVDNYERPGVKPIPKKYFIDKKGTKVDVMV